MVPKWVMTAAQAEAAKSKLPQTVYRTTDPDMRWTWACDSSLVRLSAGYKATPQVTVMPSWDWCWWATGYSYDELTAVECQACSESAGAAAPIYHSAPECV